MLFNTPTFAIFFAFVLATLPWLRLSASNLFLLAASLLFYATWDARFLVLVAFSAIFNYWTGARIAESETPARARWLIFNVAVNLGILAVFKYANFFASNLNWALQTMDLEWSVPLVDLALPLAISFYTFHCLSYSVDIYRRELEPASSFTDFALYLVLFPHLVAGPIVRASQLLPQIASPRTATRDDWSRGLFLIFWGLYKKIVVADNLAPKSDRLFALQDANATEILLGVIAFAFQIYADFSGYTDIARGSARLMGFRFDLNFNFPYLARNPSDFWRRWHISLSQWLRDYLYIPLGGGRGAEWRVHRNLMATMLVGGLWHGAAWNFVTWGAYHGSLLCLHRLWTRQLSPRLGLLPQNETLGWRSIPCILAMFALTLYGWLLFRAESMQQIGAFTKALFVFHDFSFKLFAGDLLRQLFYTLPMLLIEAWMILRKDTELVFNSSLLNGCLYSLLIYVCILFGAQGGEQFIYFNF